MSNGYGRDVQSDKFMTPKEINSLGGIGSTNVPKSVPPMDVSLRALGQNIERLQVAIQSLHGKLDPVLYPEPPTPVATQAVEGRGPRASSALGSTINQFADQIENITDRVSQMIRRCEL